MELERARADLLVAASAGATTIAVATLSGVVGVVDVGTLPSLAPLAVYALYRFSRKGGPYGSRDQPRNWAVAAAVVGAVVVLTTAVL